MLTRLLASPRFLAIIVVAAVLLPGSSRARAYNFVTVNQARWTSGSPASIWNNSTKTLTWHFNSQNFPQANWPTIAQAGAAFQNGYQTLQDVPGIDLKFARGADTSGGVAHNDGSLEMIFAVDETSDPFSQNIAGAYAVTYVRTAGGVLTDADIVMNGDVSTFPLWTTTHPPAFNSNDVEVTACHEQMHSIGGGHPVYFYSMLWPVGRLPELIHTDRCLAPDDRVLVRTLYPKAPLLGTITGTVGIVGGGFADRAVIIATDATGIPQATQVTDGQGGYTINVPAGTYSVTAHHALNSTYDSDIDFTGASSFITSASANNVVVTAGATAGAANFNVTSGPPGTPVMTVTDTAQNGGGLNSQVIFAPKGSAGTMLVRVAGTVPTDFAATVVSLGPNISVGAVSAAAAGGSTDISFSYNVAAGAAAGVRNMSFAIASGESLVLPAYFEVTDTTSALTLAASAGNPAAAQIPLGTPNAEILGFTLTANAVEDIRIRKLVFDIAGTGTAPDNITLWIDKGTVGKSDGADVRILSGNAYVLATPSSEIVTLNPPGTVTFDNIAVTVPAGQSVNFLLTMDVQASGAGAYTASLAGSAANIVSTGMFYGNVITATGTAQGNLQAAGALTVKNHQQIRTTLATVIPPGGATTETQVTLSAEVSAPSGLVGLEIELQPVTSAFTFNATPGATQAATQASGSVISFTIMGLTNSTSYHWQARPLSSVSAPGGWVSYGALPETLVDFSVDNSTVTPPSGLAQFEKDGITPVLQGQLVKGRVILSATNGTATPSNQVRLEVEVQPDGTAFTGIPTHVSALVPNGTIATVSFTGATDTYNWRARTVNVFGTASTWAAFSVPTPHFDFKRSSGGGGGGGCGATIPAGGSGLGWGLLALGLLVVFGRARGM